MKSLFSLARSCRFQGAALGLVVVALGAAGCGGGGSASPPIDPGTPLPGWRSVSPSPVQASKKWTFLVYLNAANDLEPFSGLNLKQMETIGSTNDVNIVVQIKRIGNKFDPAFTDWKDTKTRRFYVTQDNTGHIGSLLLAQNDSLDMGKAATLREFAQWGAASFPAQRYCLVLWNHGAGWRSVKTLKKGRGVSYDDTTNSHIDTIELPGALDVGRKWDLLSFDASLMQMAEVAYEVRDRARYIVGSEESPPGEGYPYNTFLGKLAQNPDMEGRELGIHIAQDTLDAYGPNSDITQSVLDASKLADIAPAVEALGKALLGVKDRYGAGIAQARGLADSYAYPQNHDLIDFGQLLVSAPSGSATARVPDAGVQSAVDGVQQAVKAALVTNVHGNAHAHSNGLAIFLPGSNEYNTIDQMQFDGFGQRYSELALTRAAPDWQTFLVQGPR